MSGILDDLIKSANNVPITGVVVGLFGAFVSEYDEFKFDTSHHTISEVAKEVKKRYGDGVFGFRRCYYIHGKQHFHDKGWVYLSGKVELKNDIFDRNLPDEKILRSNMECNNLAAIIKVRGRAFPFNKDDIVLN